MFWNNIHPSPLGDDEIGVVISSQQQSLWLPAIFNWENFEVVPGFNSFTSFGRDKKDHRLECWLLLILLVLRTKYHMGCRILLNLAQVRSRISTTFRYMVCALRNTWLRPLRALVLAEFGDNWGWMNMSSSQMIWWSLLGRERRLRRRSHGLNVCQK